MNNLMRKHCPVCNRDNILNKKIFERDFSGAASIVPFRHYDVIQCTECDMLYAGNIVESIGLENYYAMLSRYESDYNRKWNETYVYEFVEEHLRQNISVLDVGCAGGGVLNVFKQHGYTNLTGVEPSHNNCEYAKREYGITVYPATLDEYVNQNTTKKYDLIIMVHVLEHILDIRKCIAELTELLNEDGMICLNMPDAEYFVECNDIYQQFSTEHVNYFTRYSLTSLMSRMGFIAVKTCNSVLSLWKKNNNGAEVIYPSINKDHVLQYFDKCDMMAKKINRKIKEQIEEQDGYYVWGASTQTAMLIQLGIIEVSKIKGVFDGNRNYCGREVYGKMVQLPQELVNLPKYPVIISALAEREIRDYATNELHLENKIICLLDN